MKSYILILISLCISYVAYSQDKFSKEGLVLGIAGPELLHIGFKYRITNTNQLGFSAGLGPTLGGVWPTLSLEHRLYLGKNAEKTGNKLWFFRQGITFFTEETENSSRFAYNLTVGKDFPFKKVHRGCTIDIGVFIINDEDVFSGNRRRLWPAIRFAFYFQQKKEL